MSQTYKLELAEVEVVASGCDSITTKLSSLSVLPEAEMRECLKNVLAESGYSPVEGGGLVSRNVDGCRVEIDPDSLAVRVTVEREVAKDEVVKVMVPRNLADQKRDRERSEKIAKAVEEKKQQLSEEATREATAELAKALPLARREIDAVNHRWLSEALKRKAAQIGEVQRVEQNDAERTLTISIKI
jgi:hypothetical protein